MKNKLFCEIFLLLLFSNTANAMRINEIMYNPNGTDPGREWIEVYNNNEFEINISDWKFFENEVNHGITLFQGSELASVNDYVILADDAQQLLNDYPGFSKTIFESSFSLTNTGEMICIKDYNLQSINCVNYSSEIGGDGNSRTTEFSGTEWAESTVDYGTPGMENSINSQNLTNQNSIVMHANVVSGEIQIKNITVSPDYYDEDGFQIMPNPGTTKQITISAIVGNNQNEIISVYAFLNGNDFEMVKTEEINEYESLYETDINMNFYDSAGIYEIIIEAAEANSRVNKTAEFEYLPLMAIDLSSNEIDFGNLIRGSNSSVSDSLTISNLGNVLSDIEMSGSAFTNRENFLGIENLYYSIDNANFIGFSASPFMAGINLEPGESGSKSMTFKLYIPENAEPGNYSSSLVIAATEG
jgi:hypothetical protein